MAGMYERLLREAKERGEEMWDGTPKPDPRRGQGFQPGGTLVLATHQILRLTKATEPQCQWCGAQPGSRCLGGMEQKPISGHVHKVRYDEAKRLDSERLEAKKQEPPESGERVWTRAKMLSVGCPKCGAEVGQPCTSKHGNELKGDDCHTARRTTWHQAEEAEAQARRETEARTLAREMGDRYVLHGRAYNRADFLVVQCPKCTAAPGEECVTKGGKPLARRGIHMDRRHRAHEHWTGEEWDGYS